jgi:hypothetical protein
LKKKLLILSLFFLLFFLVIGNVVATMNVIIITDPTGNDLNGAAAGSMSYAKNMFQSTFSMSKLHKYAILSGGEGSEELRLHSLVNAAITLSRGGTAAQAASVASSEDRILVGGTDIGIAVGGSFEVYVVEVEDNGDISVTPHAGGLATLPKGKKGAIIHLRNSLGNPMYGTASRVREETALNIGKMIRDGYSATTIMGNVFKEVSIDSGEEHGGGALNLITGVTTGDMFTPTELDSYGYPISQPYTKICPHCGWNIGYPAANSYTTCPIDGTPLNTIYAYESLENAIYSSDNSTSVTVYSEVSGIPQTTTEIVKSSVRKNGYDSNAITDSINAAIRSGLLIGVNFVEPKDINVRKDLRAVGVYFTPLLEYRTSPPWHLPINPFILTVMGNIQTVIGIILILLIVFRTMIIKSFQRK